jgi:hypothetical protein
LVGADKARILAAFDHMHAPAETIPLYGKGAAGQQICNRILSAR